MEVGLVVFLTLDTGTACEAVTVLLNGEMYTPVIYSSQLPVQLVILSCGLSIICL